MASLNHLLVNVDLDIKNIDEKHEYQCLEMSTDELSTLISSLEEANQVFLIAICLLLIDFNDIFLKEVSK